MKSPLPNNCILTLEAKPNKPTLSQPTRKAIQQTKTPLDMAACRAVITGGMKLSLSLSKSCDSGINSFEPWMSFSDRGVG
jgi:hypothetical protein